MDYRKKGTLILTSLLEDLDSKSIISQQFLGISHADPRGVGRADKEQVVKVRRC